jgi:hypothetical protein
MMDRIRANPSLGYNGLGIGDEPPNPANCVGGGANCSVNQMIEFDQASWKCQLGEFRDDGVCVDLRDDGVIPALELQRGLPNGDGSVIVAENVLPNGTRTWRVTVRVQWTGMDGQQQQVVVDSQA